MGKYLEELPLKRVFLAAGVGLVFAMGLILLLSVGYVRQWLPPGREAVYGRIALALAAIPAAFCACRGLGTGRALCAGLTLAVLLTLLALLGLAFCQDTSILPPLLWNLLALLPGTLLGCLLSLPRKRRRRRKTSRGQSAFSKV